MGEKKGFDIEMLRHGMSHVLAKALKRIYGDIKLTIGPAIDNGFYYDVDLNKNIAPEDFDKIEELAEQICQLLETGLSQKKVSDKLDVSYNVVHRIYKRQSWIEISKKYKF